LRAKLARHTLSNRSIRFTFPSTHVGGQVGKGRAATAMETGVTAARNSGHTPVTKHTSRALGAHVRRSEPNELAVRARWTEHFYVGPTLTVVACTARRQLKVALGIASAQVSRRAHATCSKPHRVGVASVIAHQRFCRVERAVVTHRTQTSVAGCIGGAVGKVTTSVSGSSWHRRVGATSAEVARSAKSLRRFQPSCLAEPTAHTSSAVLYEPECGLAAKGSSRARNRVVAGTFGTEVALRASRSSGSIEALRTNGTDHAHSAGSFVLVRPRLTRHRYNSA
jgi:hypothetical protein